jgi:ABC-type Fe3+ transport system permease subunit
MNRIRRLVSVVTGLAAALAAAVMGAPAAFASQYPHPPGVTAHQAPVLTQQYPYPPPGELSRFEPVARHFNGVTGGMTGWQIALIAVGAAILGAIVAVLVERARATRRHLPATAG